MLSERSLKRLVVFQGVLLVGGLVLVVATIAYRIFKPEEQAAAPAALAGPVIAIPATPGRAIAVPAGTVLEGYTSEGGILILHLKTGEGRDRILILGVADGRILGDVELAPQ